MSETGDNEGLAAALSRVLGNDGRGVVACLFGSRAMDRSGPLSDLGVAVLLEGDRSKRREAHGELMDSLARELSRDDIDLVDLEEAAIPLRYRVVRDGRLLSLPTRGRASASRLAPSCSTSISSHCVNVLF